MHNIIRKQDDVHREATTYRSSTVMPLILRTVVPCYSVSFARRRWRSTVKVPGSRLQEGKEVGTYQTTTGSAGNRPKLKWGVPTSLD
jgi:hypothetical protein